MTEKEVADRWAEICRSAESAGKSALRIIEANLLKALQDNAALVADRNRWVDVAGERAMQAEKHAWTIDQMRAERKFADFGRTIPPILHGLQRMHGLHVIDSMSGNLREVAADYEVDYDDGVVQVLYVYLGHYEIMSMITPQQDLALCRQIADRIAADQIDRAEP